MSVLPGHLRERRVRGLALAETATKMVLLPVLLVALFASVDARASESQTPHLSVEGTADGAPSSVFQPLETVRIVSNVPGHVIVTRVFRTGSGG